jgi:hypothetical protein
MARTTTTKPVRVRRTYVPRTRGALSGLLLMVLGAWGALAPFIGPYFDFSYQPDKAWKWTAARGWLEVLPGAVTFVGGLLLLLSRSRVTTNLGAWMGIAGGAWFVVGPQLTDVLRTGTLGNPAGSSNGLRTAEALAFFYALGALILFLASAAFGRLSVVTLRDVRAAERRQAALDAEVEERAAAERAAADRAAAERGPNDRVADGRTVDTTRATADAPTATDGRPVGQHAAPGHSEPRYVEGQHAEPTQTTRTENLDTSERARRT